jgi:hypothetical protein
MTNSARTPSGVPVSRVIRTPGDPLVAEISTGGEIRSGTHDHYRSGTSVHLVEDRNGTCHRRIPLSADWAAVCDGVEIRHRYPVPDDRNSSAWDVRVRRDAAPIYVHILSMEESWCDDSSFGDGTSRSQSFVYAIGIDVEAPAQPSDSAG